jgi:hypothetical protein
MRTIKFWSELKKRKPIDTEVYISIADYREIKKMFEERKDISGITIFLGGEI